MAAAKPGKERTRKGKERHMKYKLILPTLALCTSSLFVAPAVAEHHEKEVHSKATMQSMGEVRISHLMDAKLKDTAGRDIGKIKDFVVDQNTGRIQFAVVDLDNQIARGNYEYAPIPFPLVARATGDSKNLVVNIDRNKLASAERYGVNRWPEQSHPTWGQDVYTYYGVPWEGAAVGATGSGVVTETVRPYPYQYEDRHDRDSRYDKPIDNGTAPDGKDVFKFHPRPWPNSEFGTE